MNKNYCIKCNKYRKLKKPKMSYIFNETLVLSILFHKCRSNKDTIFYKYFINTVRYQKLFVQLII